MKFSLLIGKPPNIEFTQEKHVTGIADALSLVMPEGPDYEEKECLYAIWPHRVYEERGKINAPIFCYESRVHLPYIIGKFTLDDRNFIPYDVYNWDVGKLKFMPTGFSLARIARHLCN